MTSGWRTDQLQASNLRNCGRVRLNGYPRCIAGSRSCPPEDVGRDSGYEAFLEAWRDPDHEEHADNRRWAGRKFDPERFDLEAANRAITRTLRLSRGDYRARR